MIDTKMNNIRGLDPDYFRKMEYPTFEVCFEDPLPFSSIVGFFKNENFKEFYLNNEYQGNFSWSVENVVDHYQNPIPQNHSLVTKIQGDFSWSAENVVDHYQNPAMLRLRVEVNKFQNFIGQPIDC